MRFFYKNIKAGKPTVLTVGVCQNTVLREVEDRRKEGHWIWYIFPQIEGLGVSEISRYYSIADLAEAKEYLSQLLLRAHLIEISEALLQQPNSDPETIFGFTDALKVQSCMTLFHHADESIKCFQTVLNQFYDGQEDWKTLAKIV